MNLVVICTSKLFLLSNIVLEMGSTPINCQRTREEKHNLVQRELAIYQWRAQTPNKCIPSVSFQRDGQIKQQEKLDQFLSRYKQKDYFELDQLRQEIEEAADNTQQIVCFQKYASNLAELNPVLEIDEIIYALDALLNSYEEIKKKYSTITVNKHCCFVTFSGQLRGWINSNPKSNTLQNNVGYSYFGQRDYRDIVLQISSMIQSIAKQDQNSNQFFIQFQQEISSKKSDIFGYARNWIANYSKRYQIMPSINLARALKRQRDSQTQPNNRNNSIRAKGYEKKVGMIKNVCLNNFRRSTNCKQALPQDLQDKFLNYNLHTENSTLTSFGCLHQSVLPPQNHSKGGFASNSTRPHSIHHNDQLETSNFVHLPGKHLLKKSYVMEKTVKPVRNDTEHSFSNGQSQQNIFHKKGGTLIQGKFLTSKQITNGMSIHRHNRNDPQRLSKSSHSESKAVRVSILDIEHEQSKGSRHINQHTSIHFQTMQQLNSTQTILSKDRPYITCKTITRLLDRSDDFDSLVHSVGTSEDKSSHYGVPQNRGRGAESHWRSSTCYQRD